MHNAFIARLLNWDHREPRGWHRMANLFLRFSRTRAQVVPRSFIWGMANVEARMNLFHLASQCIEFGIPGDIIEVGCNSGESSIVLQKILAETRSDKKLHCYDSFQGLPDLSGHDAHEGVYEKGSMHASLDTFYRNFREAGVQTPEHIHAGWFEDTIPSKLPDRIAFAMIDGDLYASTKHVLPHIYERMSPGAIGMFGIYYDESILPRPDTIPQYKSPGVKKATDEFFADKPEKVHVLYANEYSNGYFRKR